MNDHTDNLTLITGGTGKTGRRIATRLGERGVPIRIGSRSAEPRFDWEDRSSWAAALNGVRALYISYFPDIAVEGAAETVGALAGQAAAAGVERVVLLSGRGEAEAQRTEEILHEEFPRRTVVRSSWFAQNFSESYFLEPMLSGELALPVGEVGEPFVDVEDIADVATAALTEPGHEGEVYELTGPRLLSFAAAVEEISAANGREVRFASISPDAFEAGLVEQGAPGDVIALLRFLFTEVLDGRNAYVADGVERALGRSPRDFAEFACREAAMGTWGAGAGVAR